MNFQQTFGKSIREAFNEFHEQNPHVYAEFEKQAMNAIGRGRKKLSSKMIVNWIRWNMFLKTTDINWKINDAFTPMYGRLFMDNHPQYEGIFECRKLRSEEPGPYMDLDNGQVSFA